LRGRTGEELGELEDASKHGWKTGKLLDLAMWVKGVQVPSVAGRHKVASSGDGVLPTLELRVPVVGQRGILPPRGINNN
jgi:hypothetical protein